MIRVFKSENQGDKFYAMMGREFASLDIAKELERQLYNQRDTTWYIHTINNCPVGYVSVCEFKEYYYVDNLFIHIAWRHQGLASELIERVLEDFTDKPIKLIAANPYSIRIFEKNGFERVGNNGKWNKYIKY